MSIAGEISLGKGGSECGTECSWLSVVSVNLSPISLGHPLSARHFAMESLRQMPKMYMKVESFLTNVLRVV